MVKNIFFNFSIFFSLILCHLAVWPMFVVVFIGIVVVIIIIIHIFSFLPYKSPSFWVQRVSSYSFFSKPLCAINYLNCPSSDPWNP